MRAVLGHEAASRPSPTPRAPDASGAKRARRRRVAPCDRHLPALRHTGGVGTASSSPGLRRGDVTLPIRQPERPRAYENRDKAHVQLMARRFTSTDLFEIRHGLLAWPA